MSGKTAKRLRKHLGYKKVKGVKVTGDQNINLGHRFLNAPKTEPIELTEQEKAAKAAYRKAKR